MSEPIVSVEQGKLQGKVATNIYNGNFYSFQGIPYAKPPLGPLRFKTPQPPEPWSGVRDAKIEGSGCFSRDMILKTLVGSEDCLFLNVYTPQLPSASNSKLKPVMVWIHGGAFKSGSSKSDTYGPEYLLTEDIVLVTINYRLGIFGFLSFEDSSLGISGNAGLKDMVMALKWVQKNISSFSGDPNNVTIFGESAGAASVHYLVLSPLAKGLFHKAIAQSGCALNIWARGTNFASQLASVLGLTEVNEKKIFEQVANLPVEKLFELSEKMLALYEAQNNAGAKKPFAPIIEKPSEEAFLTEDPINIVATGTYNKVPLLFGYNTKEGMLIELLIKPRKPAMPTNFENIIPFMLEVNYGSDASKAIAEKIKRFYYGEKGSENVIDNFYNLHTDNYFLREIMLSTKYHAITSSLPVYLYRMSVDTSLNLYKKIGSITAPGVAHGDDIGYLFKTKISPELKPGSLEEISVKRFVKLWTNFAKNGSPVAENEQETIQWKPVNKDEINFLDIGEHLVPGVNPEAERIKFWNDIFKINPLYTVP